MIPHVIEFLLAGAVAAGIDLADWRISTEGFGPVKIGMTVEQASRQIHRELVLEYDQVSHDCYYMRPDPPIEGVAFMVSHGRISRIDVMSPGIRTQSGLRVGDEEAKAMSVLGPSTEVAAHEYLDSAGKYLTVWTSDRSKGVRVETFEGKVIKYYAGWAREVGYTEGCS